MFFKIELNEEAKTIKYNNVTYEYIGEERNPDLFEAGREKVGKKGVVREKSVHLEVVNRILDYCLSNGFSVLNLEYSPIKGPEGNIEYLVQIKKEENAVLAEGIEPEVVVENAHRELDK